MRLVNAKTKSETGFDHVIQNINIKTPFGRKALKEIEPFAPGRERELRHELSKVRRLSVLAGEHPEKIEILDEIFMGIKDVSHSIGRSGKNALTVLELFEIKNYLIQMKRIAELLQDVRHSLPKEMILSDTSRLLDILDPRRDRINTFYIYDEFSEELAGHRKEKRELELEIRKHQKDIRQRIEKDYGISLTPKFEFLVSKSNTAMLDRVKAIRELEVETEDYMTVTFSLKSNEAIYTVRRKMEALNAKIEDEELKVREELSREVARDADILAGNGNRIGELDLVLAKARYAAARNYVEPVILEEHVIRITDGRHTVVEEILRAKGKSFRPVSITLQDGVTCITGANMGGKTVSLKMAGLVALLAQYGFFVPCASAELGLSSYIHILIGDTQSMQRGLSSFGSEMEELKDILDQSRDDALIMIDEIANGTNPVEGLALTKSIVSYLNSKKYITVITTHFDNVAVGDQVRSMQVRGLAGADIDKLVRELRYANRKERIEVIAKYMDYRLFPVGSGEEIPKDALNIAKMLGIYDEIIENAKAMLVKGGN